MWLTLLEKVQVFMSEYSKYYARKKVTTLFWPNNNTIVLSQINWL